jgi:ubiquinone/menaquinone biosynthesis C-methylase UbiE
MRKINIYKEREYENLKVTNPEVRSAQDKYYKGIEEQFVKLEEKTKEFIKNKTVLEIGCSSGKLAERLAPSAKKYYGIDVSDLAIKQATEKKLRNCFFSVQDAHKILFSDNSFDVVIASGVLHHLNLSIVCDEICRLLRPNGILFAKEPLGTNPFINLYRKLTPYARTEDERPLTKSDLIYLSIKFQLIQSQYIGFFSILSILFKNKKITKALNIIDNLMDKTPLRYWFWYIWGCWKNKK